MASIKRNEDAPGITAEKSYTVEGITGGGVVIVNDDSKFSHVSFVDIDADWTVSVDGAENDDETDDGEGSTKSGRRRTKAS